MRRALAAVALAGALLGCGRGREYTGVGDVLAVDEPRLQATIRHEDIPGLMGAMTMRFAAASPDVLAGVAPGAHVRFVVRDDGAPVLVRVTAIPPGG
ncbi:MAG TPA: copper-binding protein [Candidatus Binatia bacterium]|nr:copper-binding protein [Candidatus Binatia bacterium]